MKITEAVIAWNADSDEIKVGPGPVSDTWDAAYDATAGACDPVIHKLNSEERIAMVFIYFNSAVRNGVETQAAHRAFFEIDEYREGLSRLAPLWRLKDDG